MVNRDTAKHMKRQDYCGRNAQNYLEVRQLNLSSLSGWRQIAMVVARNWRPYGSYPSTKRYWHPFTWVMPWMTPSRTPIRYSAAKVYSTRWVLGNHAGIANQTKVDKSLSRGISRLELVARSSWRACWVERAVQRNHCFSDQHGLLHWLQPRSSPCLRKFYSGGT